MKVFITGGTGFVGRFLAVRLMKEGHQVTILSRRAGKSSQQGGARLIQGDPVEKGPWQEKVAEHDVIVNLAGASIFRRWTKRARKEISESRILTTRNIVDALSAQRGKVSTLLSTSAVGFYGGRGDEELDESARAGEGFLASLTRQWEAAALEAAKAGVRVVLCRVGVVLGPQGGALQEMIPAFRRGMGSPLGRGKQWMSWIHCDDLVEAMRFLIARSDISGAVNCVAPFRVTNREFTKALAQALGALQFLPAIPSFILKAAMGEFAGVLLEGQKVVPKKLLDAGFVFGYSKIGEALREIVTKRG